MEEAETWDTQQNKTDKRIHQLKQIGYNNQGVVKNPISQNATEHDNGTVKQKDAPVWQ